jgi:hypothetical protein
VLFKPQLPPNPTLTPHTAVSSLVRRDDAPTCSCHHHTASAAPVAPTRRYLPAVSTGAIAVVLVGGVVLTALLAAVAVTAVSVAVAAVVLRSLLNAQRHR